MPWVFATVRYTKSRLWGSDGKRFRLVRVDPKKGAKSWTIGPLVRWKLLKRSVLCKLLNFSASLSGMLTHPSSEMILQYEAIKLGT